MRLIVAGSRSITSAGVVYRAIEKATRLFGMPSEIIGGLAVGADSIGQQYATQYCIPFKAFPADWAKNGKRAGHVRNMDMAKYADAALIVWDGYSPGSQSMMACMDYLEKPKLVEVIKFPPPKKVFGTIEEFLESL